MRFEPAVPVLRVFDQAKADEFYLGYLGFATDWEHRFEPGLPRYVQIRRSELLLHLSEHHGDGTPGSVVFLPMQGILEFHTELCATNYPYQRPAVQDAPWGTTIDVTDPFGNQLRFCQR